MKKQKIEDIFSSMEDFSSVPPPELWSQIEEKLDKPKKKKRVVLWWSAAACLLLGLLLPSILHFTDSSKNTNLNNDNLENSRNTVVIDKEKNDIHKNKNLNQNKNTGKAIDSLHENATKNQFNIDPQIQIQETSVVETNSKNKTSKKDSKSNIITPANAPTQSVAFQNSGSSEEKSSIKSSQKSILENKPKSSNSSNKGINEERIAFGKQSKFNSTAKKQLSNSIFEEQLASKNNKNIAFNNQHYSANNNPVANSNTYNSKNLISGKNETKRTDKAVIIKDDIKIANSLSKTDSMQLAELQNLEKGILSPEKEKEEKEKKDNLINKKERWAVAVFAGVASSENTKNDKTLGNVNDSKQSNSYGVKTKYSINKKWAVGSGLKISELGQSVANVSYVSTKGNAFFTSDSYPVVSANSPTQEYLLISNSTKEALKNENVQTGKLDQNLRYVEMPLEVSYSILTKNKASINLNTGGFVGKLISNNVALDGHSIGENTNANDYVYGSTLSSTVQYRVYKKTNVFVEPAVNYYINPLNSQSFNQFQWGLNFGLNVNF
ncbi:hypothetical protein [Flavobacterium nitrogenifigens]|uniref:Outer membrane protein beta-barrel domain-containing protein n=1 Tax=Flavobacterium nitrogenifigens TaxID=1617283 RepID=A0A521EKL6_9FLAO|nr:hypothetical protein [Flavobacterium nitrogenifigens]KAF2326168.1 hypothetical protein DM397_23250 [Flavobacterium nitrogenifigens]SMO84466.1 hypothetical protein SAMN06265220_104393 [Flavobacterium nitrogenifigens]